MGKEVKCAWCGETVTPTVSTDQNNLGKIKVRKCPKCGNILAAYLDEGEKDILDKVRTFQNLS
ncbi:MAG: hypothetical protein HYY20_10055 [Candidatus Tectomicrobia bacterium]|uniref:Uncharacterized protein n=1 Tax=Tectimicrobiota bacterium TaxID=2528274 RepID=A0A932FX56_UNCTE|nr:hypothetical protein [Candidatus Tectomicrobia bacterium]